MSSRLPRRAATVRVLAAVAALAPGPLLTACSDPSSPRDAGLPVGMYVLRSQPLDPTVAVLAETLFVETAATYRYTGLYRIRGDGDRYERHPVRTAARDADGRRIVATRLTSGAVVTRGDTVLLEAHEPGLPPSEVARFVAAPPPPAAGPLASLVLTTADTMVRHGESIDLAPLVVRGLDATGRWIADPAFTVVAPAGWAASGGLLTAPTRDEVGVARVTASGVTAEVRVHAVPDVTTRRWELSFSCADPFSPQFEHVPDSLAFRLVVDSSRYAPATLPSFDGYPYVVGRNTRFAWAVAALYASGTRTSWKHGLATDSPYATTLPMIAQRADAVTLGGPGGRGDFPVVGTVLGRTDAPTRTYVAPEHGGTTGGAASWDRHFCRELVSFRRSGPVRLTELP